MTLRSAIVLTGAAILAMATDAQAHAVSHHHHHEMAGAARAVTAPGPADLAGEGALAALGLLVAVAGTFLAVRAAALRSSRLRLASLAAAVLLAATTIQAAPHIVHHVFDEDGGATCKVKRQADLVVGLSVDVALPAPSVAELPLVVLREPDPPGVFRPVDRSRAPPAG